MIQGELKWGAFRAAEVFILPSHQENFGISVVESLACSLPVLISNKVNIWREVIRKMAQGSWKMTIWPARSGLLTRWLALSPDERQGI